MKIAIDFDGTCVTHEYPNVGTPLFNCINVLTKLQNAGHQLILYTMRSGNELRDAVTYLQGNGIKLYGVNKDPDQSSWTSSPKCFANLYIDDAALGCPTLITENTSRKEVDWIRVEQLLTNLF